MRAFLRVLLTLVITGAAVYWSRDWRYASALIVVVAAFVAVWFGFAAVWPRRSTWWRAER